MSYESQMMILTEQLDFFVCLFIRLSECCSNILVNNYGHVEMVS